MNTSTVFLFNTPDYNKLSVIKEYQTISIRLDNSNYLSMLKFYDVDAKTCFFDIIDTLSKLYEEYAEMYQHNKFERKIKEIEIGKEKLRFKIEITSEKDIYFTVETDRSKTNIQLNIAFMHNHLFRVIERVDIKEDK